jgi:hypothetical protein
MTIPTTTQLYLARNGKFWEKMIIW